MRSRLFVSLLCLAAATGCSHPRPGRPVPLVAGPPPTSQTPGTLGYPQPVRPLPAPEATDGVYVLESVGGSALPVTVDGPGECAPRVLSGTLSLVGERFSFSQTLETVCNGRTSQAVQRADGRFRLDVSTIRLSADAGGAFTTATGVFGRGGTLQLVELTGPGRERSVDWRFRRDPNAPRTPYALAPFGR
jgi:hypothetical protein